MGGVVHDRVAQHHRAGHEHALSRNRAQHDGAEVHIHDRPLVVAGLDLVAVAERVADLEEDRGEGVLEDRLRRERDGEATDADGAEQRAELHLEHRQRVHDGAGDHDEPGDAGHEPGGVVAGDVVALDEALGEVPDAPAGGDADHQDHRRGDPVPERQSLGHPGRVPTSNAMTRLRSR